MKLNARTLSLIGFFCCVLLLGSAFYFEYKMHLEPCPLCMLQRVILACLAIIWLASLILNPKEPGIKCYAGFALLFSVFGMLASGRQVWLQHQPLSTAGVCMPGFRYMIKHLPWQTTLKAMFTGTTQCSEVVWRFWGFSMPEWSLLCFLIFGIFAILQLRKA